MAHSTKVPEGLFEFTPIVFVGAFDAGGEEEDSCLNIVLSAFVEE